MAKPARQRAAEQPELGARPVLQARVAAAILEAAATTLARGGDHVNLADVAAAAGVARATVYRYFPNRGLLLDELARVTLASADERLTAARIGDVSVEEGLSRAVRVLVDLGDAFVVLVRERSSMRADDFERCVVAPLRRLLDGGRSSGQIRADIPAALLAEALLGTVAAVQVYGSLGRDDTVAAVARLFLEGAGTEARNH